MFSPSTIVTERKQTTILFRSAYPLLKRGKKIKKSHPKFPFKVVYVFRLNGFTSTDDLLSESSILQKSPETYSLFLYTIELLGLLCLSTSIATYRQEASLLHPQS